LPLFLSCALYGVLVNPPNVHGIGVGRAAQWIILAVELSRIVGMDWVSLRVLSDGIINNNAVGLLLDSGSKALWAG
jgi:hypothetical protein